MFRLECYLFGNKVKDKMLNDSLLKATRVAKKLVQTGQFTAVAIYNHENRWLKEYVRDTR
ncbi:hypothetical protein G7L40_20085 [Paenibacillus polymyxa]|uniref:Uncharacterized protein n=1 Tax=Paenibacillus polymyxa TaxID=1406 RepID=A0A378Y0Q4_PAEPO|nr:hypothetical protein [Paenibacillus polymyxa]MBE7896211.1 hypothetical protein [Paenibacillus polymyxa]MBG9765853.1 hypothetical protein [Paenibacillus polymyxa]MCC3256740.1 hypothetical protein [Paenibacillus polymyxa]QPK54772.1 hypothetical protein G7035_20125 [Paenibacillus polymyxa]QPK59863.1 hypothetical protein G7L40_20085 [Paenibacillus polymyxa]